MSTVKTFLDGKINRESLLSQTFDAIKWPLSILVVINHYFRAYLYTYGTDTYDLTTSNAANYIEIFIISFFRNFSVPIFYFISGYLVYCGSKFSYKKYQNRVKKLPRTIIKPYIIWNSFAILLIVLATLIAGKSLNATFILPDCSNRFVGFLQWLRMQYLGNPFPINEPLWYMRDYVVILLVLPIVHCLLKLTRGYILLGFAILFILYFNDNSWLRIPNGLLFFYSGYWMRLKEIDALVLFKRLFKIALAGWIICGIYYYINFDRSLDQSIEGVPYPYSIIKNIGICCLVPVAIYGMASLVKHNLFKNHSFFASASFFIYVVHYPIHDYIFHWSFRMCKNATSNELAIILGAITIITPLILTWIYYVLQKHIPKVMKYLNGR